MFSNVNLSRKSQFEQTAYLLSHRYVEHPIRRCRNLSKLLLDLQQVCNQGPCTELPQVVPGRTTSSAAVSGWYASPWQQVHLFMLSPLNVSFSHSWVCCCIFQLKIYLSGTFHPVYDNACALWDSFIHCLLTDRRLCSRQALLLFCCSAKIGTIYLFQLAMILEK